MSLGILRVPDDLAVDPGELIDGLFGADAKTGVAASGRAVRAGRE